MNSIDNHLLHSDFEEAANVAAKEAANVINIPEEETANAAVTSTHAYKIPEESLNF